MEGKGGARVIYVTVALFAEARPIIDRFRLKKATLQPAGKFQTFAGDGMALIVSGTGALAAAVATAALLSARPPEEDDVFLNIGLCGAVDPGLRIGQAVLAHKIVHRETGRAYYPDVLVRHPFREAAVETVPRVVRRVSARTADAVDMEAAGCFEAALAFLPPHRLAFVKIVSDRVEVGGREADHGETRDKSADKRAAADGDGAPVEERLPREQTGEFFAAERVAELIEACLDDLENWLFQWAVSGKTSRDGRSEIDGAESRLPGAPPHREEEQLVAFVSDRLRLTETMRCELRRLVRHYRLKTGRVPTWLLDRTDPPPESKREVKLRFEQIRKELLSSSFFAYLH